MIPAKPTRKNYPRDREGHNLYMKETLRWRKKYEPGFDESFKAKARARYLKKVLGKPVPVKETVISAAEKINMFEIWRRESDHQRADYFQRR